MRELTPDLVQHIIDGAYWMRRPGVNAEVVIAFSGAVAPEAVEAAGLLSEDRRDIGLLAITSADRLNAGWSAAQRDRQEGNTSATSHIEQLLAPLSRDCGIVTVIDGHPAALAWLGSAHGHRLQCLGVEHFGQTGSIDDLYRHYRIDTNAILDAAETLTPGRPVRYRKSRV
jgi:pyruvate dehydrogenase E1 component